MPSVAYIPLIVFSVAVALVIYAVIYPLLKRYRIIKVQPARRPRRKKRKAATAKKRRKGVWIRVL